MPHVYHISSNKPHDVVAPARTTGHQKSPRALLTVRAVPLFTYADMRHGPTETLTSLTQPPHTTRIPVVCRARNTYMLYTCEADLQCDPHAT